MPETIYLVDASTFIHRSYHAIPHLSARDGQPTNALYGLAATLHKLLREKKPRYIALAFDSKGRNFRHETYSDYKANRPPMPDDLAAQQEPIRQMVEALGPGPGWRFPAWRRTISSAAYGGPGPEKGFRGGHRFRGQGFQSDSGRRW